MEFSSWTAHGLTRITVRIKGLCLGGTDHLKPDGLSETRVIRQESNTGSLV